jgi:hypothetical protein
VPNLLGKTWEIKLLESHRCTGNGNDKIGLEMAEFLGVYWTEVAHYEVH